MKKMLVMIVVLMSAGALICTMLTGCDDSGSSGGRGSGTAKEKSKSPDGKRSQKAGEKPIVNEEHAIPGQPTVSDQKGAETVIAGQKETLGLGKDDDLKIDEQTKDDYGNEYYQVQQTYKGLPVYGYRSVLEIEDGRAVVLSGAFSRDINLPNLPVHKAQQAVEKALKKLGMAEDLKISLREEQKKIVYISTLKAHLAWLVTVDFKVPLSPSEIMVVDAHTPKVLSRTPEIQE